MGRGTGKIASARPRALVANAAARLDFRTREPRAPAATLAREPLKLLTRYILREHIGPLVFALSSLTALLLLQQVAKQFGNLVGKGLGWAVIGEFFVLSIPFIIAMTMPMAVLVAVLYAFSRLTSENEVTALRASGISVMRLVRPAIVGGAVLGLVMLAFNDQVLPRSNHRLRTLQTDIARKKPTFALREQVINEVMPGKLFLRTSHIDEATDRMREVTIYNFDDPERRKTIYSDSGVMGMTPDQRDLQMTLHDGYMQQIPRDNLGELTRLYFKTDLVRVRGVGNRFEQTERTTTSRSARCRCARWRTGSRRATRISTRRAGRSRTRWCRPRTIWPRASSCRRRRW